MPPQRYSKNYNKVLAFFTLFYKQNGVAPTHRQIMDGIGLKSTSHVSIILKTLYKEGKLTLIRRGTYNSYKPSNPPANISPYINEELLKNVRRVSRQLHE